MFAATSDEGDFGVKGVAEFDFLRPIQVVVVLDFAVAKLAKRTPAPTVQLGLLLILGRDIADSE